eukprot:351002-Chlamydomonas_euryale.AAC.28
MQMHPHLASNRRGAAVQAGAAVGATSATLVLLDVAKAYDSLDREFLYAAMEKTGAGMGLVRWARTLLTGTCAAA